MWQTANNPPQPTTFTGTQNPTRDVDIHSNSPYDYFKLIFDDNFIDMIVRETNCYSSQYITNTVLSTKARAKSWKPVTRMEMEVFLGLVLLSGLIDKKGRLASYYNDEVQGQIHSQTILANEASQEGHQAVDEMQSTYRIHV